MLNVQIARITCIISIILVLSSCSVQQKISKSAKQVISDSSLLTAHVGISIYEPATGKYWYNYQGDKYFVPASNTKLATCYAAMKYLGDSLVGLRYQRLSNSTWIEGTADPTFLHPDFKNQPVLDFFKKDTSILFMFGNNKKWQEESLGSGWTWNDFSYSYMAERSLFPIYGNVIRFYVEDGILKISPSKIELDYGGSGDDVDAFNVKKLNYSFSRKKDQNIFLWNYSKSKLTSQEVPFITSEAQSVSFIRDTVKGIKITWSRESEPNKALIIHSQPTDSLLKPMMHRSDNFFAEQSLLMVSNERLGVMNDEKIIDTLLKTDFKDLPQKPRWVDGSGLSRYNLFTPQDFVAILNKMKNEFGMERIKIILPTGGAGTISNYYKADSNFIFGKTGTLSGVVAFSGFLYTKKGKLLIFSTLVNNHQASSTAVRRAVEKFIEGIRNKY
jgi:D-alanyl-D-alanine carboxypeptidase/D-alanyl-D-alanine-endopeptidase (penicillin-binding protein 4)